MDALLFKVTMLLPNLMKIDTEISERHQFFFAIQDYGSRQVDFGLPGLYRYHTCVVYQSATFTPNLVEIGHKLRERHQFSKLKMAAAAMLTSVYEAFFDIMDVLFFKIASFPPTLVEIGQKLREWHQFFEIQHGGGRNFEKNFCG